MSYELKYLKYKNKYILLRESIYGYSQLNKNKYLSLKNMMGGDPTQRLKSAGIEDMLIKSIMSQNLGVDKALEFMGKLKGIKNIPQKNALLGMLLLIPSINMNNLNFLKINVFDKDIHISSREDLQTVLNFSQKELEILNTLITLHWDIITERGIGNLLSMDAIAIIKYINEGRIKLEDAVKSKEIILKRRDEENKKRQEEEYKKRQEELSI